MPEKAIIYIDPQNEAGLVHLNCILIVRMEELRANCPAVPHVVRVSQDPDGEKKYRKGELQ